MTESLAPDDSCADLPALIRAEIANARAALDMAEDDPVVAFHEARKAIKKARSNARLMRKADKDASKRINAAGRRAAHMLAEARDADSLEQIARAAAIKCDDADLAAVLREEADRARADGERVDRAEAADQARAMLDEMERETAAAGPITEPGTAVAKGLARTYARACDRLAEAKADPNGVTLHELRKRVKDWRHHAEALGDVWPGGIKARRRKAKTAADLLGDHHDLVRLIERLEAREGDGLDAAIESLRTSRDRLAKKALKRTARAFRRGKSRAKKKLVGAA
ncbi:hypothetical protein DDZ18_02950 [Marinicauda salina]|uniref:CHAD domain-containing protein n=1 Tax=Marinicauda salina TaxID=2135793 RepID=A0A2U2BX31_9PROT|nr:CHAD domain-containing protein [Marinicauda salina]PWE18578.1 hypothetical protein DDZ18_02950 [Marinicauda salina]